jgi:hypothetical protein
MALTAARAEGRLDFNRDVRPILANHCWRCHGPDEKARQAGLRLDLRETALRELESGATAVVPRKPESSALVARIESSDTGTMMPPPKAKKPLTAQQKSVLRRWVQEGAEFAPHWAFVPPRRPSLPRVRQAAWPRTPVDYFVLERLEREGLRPSAEASRAAWLRRVTLDLTGLPPTPEELGAFLADASPSAHERVVDRLLASPRYAERMAMHWLDAARYADTNGYNNDEVRSMWPWRDWVIEAFARGMPYDQFLTEQIAGDLLPDVRGRDAPDARATVAQKVASGFNRNHVLTTEGGIIEEEYHVEYVADRVHTTATVFLALSLQCARCHDHKYDPISQRDYYRFAAFLNNVSDRIVGYSQGRMAEPLLKVPTEEQQAELARLQRRHGELETAIGQRAATIDAAVATWEQGLSPADVAENAPLGLVAHFPLDETTGDRVADAADKTRHGTIRGKAVHVPGKFGGSLEFDGQTFVEAGQAGSFEGDQKFSLSAWVYPTSNEPSTVLSKMDEANAFRGYDVILEGAKVASHFVHHWPDKAFKVITKEPIALNAWHHVAVTCDGTRKAGGVRIYVDGQERPLDVSNNSPLEGTLTTDKPFHIGKRQETAHFRGKIDDVQLFAAALTKQDVARLAAGQAVHGLKETLATPRAARTAEQQQALRQHYLDHIDRETPRLKAALADLRQRAAEIESAVPVTMVMQETQPARKTYILRRGQYDQRGEEVAPGVPSVLSAMPKNAPANRLGLATWLTSPGHPLTARVAVNRSWELFFGTGLVETAEDFGVQGAWPSHPELLDWLATELVRTGWDQRAILRSIVLSATYRQSSQVTRELLERDPHNRLLARGPRYRMPAETVRDNALFLSGLLQQRLGGPSVKRYQPEGLWEDVSVERRDKYVADQGEGLYRRSMYTFWKRTCPPPAMSTLDAPDRETCVIRRARTNTPLQALVLLNDPTYVEAARNLAQRVLTQAKSSDQRLFDDRIATAYRWVLCREPSAGESRLLLNVYTQAHARFKADRSAADKLLGVGRSPRDGSIDPIEHAAWTSVMSVLLNLDEAISKT